MIPLHTLVAAATVSGLLGAQVSPAVSYLQFPDCYVRDAVLADLDGDGSLDVVAAISTKNPHGRRLSMHLRAGGEPRFRTPADRVLELVQDVVAYAVADVDPNPGAEIVLLSPTRAVSVVWRAGEERPSYAPLATFDLLWQPPKSDYAFSWQTGVVDLDGDGLDDLVLPHADGYGVFVQRRGDAGTSFIESFVELPPRAVTDRVRGEARIRNGGEQVELSLGDERRPDLLVEIHDPLAPPRFVDWNADGRVDVVALVEPRLVVFEQQDDGRFARAPTRTFPLPERGLELFDPSAFADVADFDGDGRAEFVLVSGRSERDAMSSLVEVFRQDDDGELLDTPSERLLLQGFVSRPRFDDVDGDGVLDLSIGSLRTDLIDTLAQGSSGRIDAQLNLFIGRSDDDGTRFRRPVAMVHPVAVPSRMLRDLERVVARFAHDVDGDGLRDLFVRLDGRELRVLRCAPRGRGYELGEPLWNLTTAENAAVQFERRAAALDLLIVEDAQVIHVEFR